jgi:uncharacterized membrane protein
MLTGMPPLPSRRPVVAGLLLGLGLGGFFDGIVFHQLLRWHHLVCSTETCVPHSVAEYELRTFQDGLFHALCWVLTTAGAVTLAAAPHRSLRAIVGYILAGWGLFNLVEGLIDHQILGIHHVRPGPTQHLWDYAFLAWGAVFAVGGFLMARGRARGTPPEGGAAVAVG